jgi:hypothetical protein
MGETQTRAAFMARLRRFGPALFVKGLGWRLLIGAGLAAFLIPGYWLALRSGFLVEKTWFAERQPASANARVDRLLRASGGDLFVRSLGIGFFVFAVTVSLFLLADYAANLFNMPIFIGRIADSLPSYGSGNGFPMTSIAADAFYLLGKDPRVLTALTAATLLVYPIGRLAWFFCYVDVRVRRDLWDAELEFARLGNEYRHETETAMSQ